MTQTQWPPSVCCRLDALPCEPNALADMILSSGEREHWTSMRAVEKRRHEWLLGRAAAKQAVRSLLKRDLDLSLLPEEIEIVPDPYGRPLVKCARGGAAAPALSIAHSHGTAVALAVLDPEARVGVDLESLAHRRGDFESIAFSPDERGLLEALLPDARREWALRMWCAKEALGKALGRGLSAGLLAFHLIRIEAASGFVELELRDSALQQFPQFHGKTLIVYTERESD
ncbi:MAG: 4'-phosphopantetheinyl transferase superfamily protein, partial [Rhodopila sp.]